MQKLITDLFNNPHTSWSAIALFAATVVGILFPKVKPQADEIARAAIMYGLIRAGDASANQASTTITTTPTTPKP